MFERFTVQARAAVMSAVEEARAAAHGAVGTEHILLGLLRAAPSLDVELTEARDIVRRTSGWPEPTQAQTPFTPAAQRALKIALLEAVGRGRIEVESEDLLLALLGEPEGGARQVLLALGVSADQMRRELIRLADGAVTPDSGGFGLAAADLFPRDELELGWRARPIALAALGAAVLGRSAFDPSRTGTLSALEMQLLVHLALGVEAAATSGASPGEAVESLAAALACGHDEVALAIEGLRRVQLVVDPAKPEGERVAITPAGVARVEQWLGRAVSLFGGWPRDHPGVDDATS